MKKVVLSLAILMLSGGVVFAQKANVNKAKNKALSTENPDFEGAREAIKQTGFGRPNHQRSG